MNEILSSGFYILLNFFFFFALKYIYNPLIKTLGVRCILELRKFQSLPILYSTKNVYCITTPTNFGSVPCVQIHEYICSELYGFFFR